MKPRGKKVIGLTGNSGSGKSTVAGLLAAHGGYIIDADVLAHAAILRGSPAYDDIRREFGDEILDVNGEINRKALGQIVFNHKAKLKILEGIVHRQVVAESLLEIGRQAQNPAARFIVLDAPLLIEAGMHRWTDAVWVCTAPRALRLRRIVARDGLSLERAEERLRNDRQDDFFRPWASLIIATDESTQTLQTVVEEALGALLNDTEK